MKPVSVAKDIDYNAFQIFIELIHNTPDLSKLSSFDMLPEELVRLCGRRYLSEEHHGLHKNLIQCSLLFYVFMETLLLTSSSPVKDKWNQVNIKNCFFFFNFGYNKTMGQICTFIAENGLTGCHSPYVCTIKNQTQQHMAILWDDPLQGN